MKVALVNGIKHVQKTTQAKIEDR